MAYNNSYTPTNYSAKDSALTGSEEKKLKGSDFSDGSGGDFDRIKFELDKIRVEFDRLAQVIGTAKGVFASVTYPGGSGPVNSATTHNVSSVEWVNQTQSDGQPTWKFARVRFATPIPGSDGQFPANPSNGELDANVNIQVTPFANISPANSLGFPGFVKATITNIDKDGCEIAFVQSDRSGVEQVCWYQAFCLLVAVN